MRGLTHVCAAILVTKFLNFSKITDFLFVALITLVPDIDHPKSFFGKLKIFKFIYVKFGHRTLTHSLIFSILITNLFVMNINLYKLAWIGIGTHIVLDMLTYSGVYLLWPLRKTFVIFGGKFLTGDWKEIIIIILSLSLFILN